MLAAEYTIMNKIDQISALLELMVLVKGREGDTENIGGTENSRCKVLRFFPLSSLTEDNGPSRFVDGRVKRF